MTLAPSFTIPDSEIEWTAIRAQGAGGQNVNKVSSAVQVRFDIRASSLPDEVKMRLLELRDQRVSTEGFVVIKAQRHRTQERNREDAIARLHALVHKAATVAPPRKPTRPTAGSERRRVESKIRRAQTKAGRRRISDAE